MKDLNLEGIGSLNENRLAMQNVVQKIIFS